MVKFRYFCIMNYRAIVFDLGGVIINLNYQATADAFKRLGLTDFDAIYSQAKQDGIFDDFETGKSTPAEFRKRLRTWLGNEISDTQIDMAWNAMLLDIPAERIALLRELKKHYRVFLLSNTNEIHLNTVFRIMQETHGLPDFSSLLEKQYFSSRINMRKPDPDIFRFVLKENNLSASEVFFIDDSIQHIEGARSLGIDSHHLQPGEKLQHVFSGFLPSK
jgi:FMN phosphatase YigB (HAD superfamily)